MAALRRGYILDRWRDMRVVLIPKLGRNLIQTKNWRPLNLMNCVGKLGEKVAAGKIQGQGESVLHDQQFGSVRSRSAIDVLYKSVMEVRKCLKDMGSLGWAFWDVKGGFQNVRSAQELARMAGCGPLQCWNTWLERLMSLREFKVAWDGKVRRRGTAHKGVRQRSPLSPFLFLVYMAPILEKIEQHVKEEVGRVTVRFPSYMNDLHCGLYDK